jgi:predicted Co/Zn/Cd cation transporter (cation efflux family)
MKNILKDILSGPDGHWSFGRCSSAGVLLMAMVCFAFVTAHLLHTTDANMVSVWLSNTPIILMSVAGVIVSLYGIGKAGEALPEVIRAIQRSKQDGQ